MKRAKDKTRKIRLSIRKAIPADKAPVLKFCMHTWRGGDYIPEVWDDWMKERNGRLLVATIKEVPVGVAHAYFQTPSDAWLEGVRVDPDYRGYGIAGRLNKELLAWARKRGAKAARLCTGEDNTASRRHLLKTGFKPLQTFFRYVSTRPLKKDPGNTKRAAKYNRTFWHRVAGSEKFGDYRGLYADGWTWYPLTQTTFKKLVGQKKVFQRMDDNQSRDSFAIVTREDRGFTLGLATGTSRNVEAIARHARYLLKNAGARKRARALIPPSKTLTNSFRKAGYNKTGATIVYEKTLP